MNTSTPNQDSPPNTPNPPNSREEAVREWEKQTNESLLKTGTTRNYKAGFGIAAGALVLLLLVYFIKSEPSPAQSKQANPDVDIAERKPVPKLKAEEPVPEPPKATETPAQAVYGNSGNNDAEMAETQRKAAEQKMLDARMKSALIASGSASSAPSTGEPPSSDSNQVAGTPNGLFGAQSQEKGAQDVNSRFARSVSGNGVAVSQARQLTNLQYKVLQGKLIEAVLEPRAVSDLAGMVCATVQRDVFGNQGRNKLIPWGSRVCGVYSSELRKGQNRIFVVWNTLRTPQGVEVTLDSAGADQLGSAGMGGLVDTHFSEMFGTAALLSIIGAGASNVGVESNDQSNSATYYRQSVQQAAAQTAQQVLQPSINIQPTVTVRAGSKVRIYVNKDLDFSSLYEEKAKATDQPTYIF